MKNKLLKAIAIILVVVVIVMVISMLDVLLLINKKFVMVIEM